MVPAAADSVVLVVAEPRGPAVPVRGRQALVEVPADPHLPLELVALAHRELALAVPVQRLPSSPSSSAATASSSS